MLLIQTDFWLYEKIKFNSFMLFLIRLISLIPFYKVWLKSISEKTTTALRFSAMIQKSIERMKDGTFLELPF